MRVRNASASPGSTTGGGCFKARRTARNGITALLRHAATVPSTDRQRVATELGYSETIFIDVPDSGSTTAHAHIFTPATELAATGGATTGAPPRDFGRIRLWRASAASAADANRSCGLCARSLSMIRTKLGGRSGRCSVIGTCRPLIREGMHIIKPLLLGKCLKQSEPSGR